MRTLLTLILLSACGPAHAEIRGLRKIDDHIYLGKQPRLADFQELQRMGIKTDLDLRGGPIHKPRERRHAEAAGLGYISIRLSGIWEPHDEQIAHVLSVMEDPARWPIYLHCWRGDDRVGMVVACYRMHFYHWTAAQAIEEANQDHLNRFEVLLRQYIRHFDPSRIVLTPPAPAVATPAPGPDYRRR